jgi:hypothetical protein
MDNTMDINNFAEKLKVGDKIRVKGDTGDFTDHLDGQWLTVTDVEVFSEGSIKATDSDGDEWYIWISNIEEVEHCE